MNKKELKEKLKNITNWEKALNIILKNNNIIYNLGIGLKGKVWKFNKNKYLIEFKMIKNKNYYKERERLGDDFYISMDFGDFILYLLDNKI